VAARILVDKAGHRDYWISISLVSSRVNVKYMERSDILIGHME
jgi:hypothetical protein